MIEEEAGEVTKGLSRWKTSRQKTIEGDQTLTLDIVGVRFKERKTSTTFQGQTIQKRKTL